MKISELQELLEKAKEEYGDIEIKTFNDEFGSYHEPYIDLWSDNQLVIY